MIVVIGTAVQSEDDDYLEYLLFGIDLESLNALRHYGDSFGYQSLSCFGIDKHGYFTQIHFLRKDVIL